VELDGTATQEQYVEVEQAIAYFREWTGRDTICVETIGLGQLEPVGEETAWGFFFNVKGSIEIYTKQGEEGGHLYIAIHEMCHALDFMEDISLSYPEAFPPIEDPEKHYKNEKARIQESFGRVCGNGLAYTDLRWVVDEECGDEDDFGLTEGHRIVAEEVYTEVNQQRLSDERLTVDVVSTARIEPPVGTLMDSATVNGYFVQLILQDLQRAGVNGPVEPAVELHLRDLQTGQLAHRFTIEHAARTRAGELLGRWTIPEGDVISVIQEGEEATVWVADIGLNVLQPYSLETPEAELSNTTAAFVNSTLA